MSDADLSSGVAWLDGRYIPVAEATISVLDWGFTRSDVTYDVAHTWNGRFFRLDAHLDRFTDSLAHLRLDPGLDRGAMKELLHGCVAASGLRDAYVEMLCTRGLPPRGVRDPRNAENRFVAYALPFVWIADERQRREGLTAVVADFVKRIPPGAVDPRVKNFHWLDLVRGLFEAYDRGAETVILSDGEGNVTEGPGFNVFAIRDGIVHTPDHGVLLGVTRRSVLELCERLAIPTAVGPLPVAALSDADEIFATSTAGGVMPVTSLDGHPVGKGTTGELTHRIHDVYWAAHEDEDWTTPVDYENPPLVARPLTR